MLHALLHRKLRGEFNREPRNIEDLLTSVVFGACAYAGAVSSALLPFLAGARTVDGKALSTELAGIADAQFDFWPSWSDATDGARAVAAGGEPDLLLRLGNGNKWHSVLLIEAKLWSGKSSRPTVGGLVTDQLAKYWLGLKSLATEERLRPLGVVYLTSGTSLPLGDLEEAQGELEQKGHSRAPFYWLSWRQFERRVEQASASQILKDAVRLLRDEWQLVEIEMGRWPARTPALRPWKVDIAHRWPHVALGAPWSFDR